VSAAAVRFDMERAVVRAAREQCSRPHRIAPMLRAECWGLKEGNGIRCPLCAALMALDALDAL
jgi:hypothetical protein